jgi:hypothetical protein
MLQGVFILEVMFFGDIQYILRTELAVECAECARPSTILLYLSFSVKREDYNIADRFDGLKQRGAISDVLATLGQVLERRDRQTDWYICVVMRDTCLRTD